MGLNVRIGRLSLKNPVMAASGTFGAGEEYSRLFNINKLGAIVTKTITLRPRAGNPPPRIVECKAGLLNSIGLENKGYDEFVKYTLSFIKRLKVPVIVSIAGDDIEEYKELSRELHKIRSIIGGIEVNISCPNIKGGLRFSTSAKALYRLIKAIRTTTTLTLIAKLSPHSADLVKLAISAKEAGADAVCVSNTFPAMAVDIESQRPRLGGITGGLSGPAIKTIVIKMVWDIFRNVDIPVVGVGGIMDYKDALEYIICGATSIQVGTANFVDPLATVKIIDGIKDYLNKRRIKDIKHIIGTLKTETDLCLRG